MAASRYSFVTHWSFDAPIDAVWAELYRPADWPAWWRGVLSVEQLEAGDAAGIGSRYRMVMRSALPYALAFDTRTARLEKPRIIEAKAEGELAGTGLWTLTPTATGTAVRYDWNVEANKWWMRWLEPVARPIFEWNHDVIMRWGEMGLRTKLTADATSSPPQTRATAR